MNEIETSFLTIIGGIVVYTGGKIVEKFIIEPVFNQKEIVGNIADALIYYADLYSNPYNSNVNKGSFEDWDRAKKETRKLATLLNSRTFKIPFYAFLKTFKMVIPKKDIEDASFLLIRLSNSYISSSELLIDGVANSDVAREIKEKLQII